MTEPARCPSCGGPLDSVDPGGHCPRCLLQMGLAEVAGTADGGDTAGTKGGRTAAVGIPSVIGPYHLLQVLGEGGMGLVYLAEQREPLVRRVALKLIKPGMDSREVLARFEAERHALALMDHPGIARVLDAGLGPEQRPYFVMEYVAGVPITDYCDRHRLPNAERLEIFLQVCAAVQHAHQKGIIHRDIKPQNILVTVQDGKPVPKVIDFGIAKATRQGEVAHAAFTRLGALIGTPEYISPEQAESDGLEVDTTTDIYSLGVVLYELLTGVLPFEGEVLRQAGYAEMRRIIREEDPKPPSVRVTALGATAADVARQHQVTLQALGKQLQGDLDAIAMKALEKDRTRRYASASEFAADISRYVNGEPVTASPPSAVYRTRKFVRRHRLGVAAATFSIAALLIGLVLSTVFFVRSEAARKRAELEAASNRLDAEAMLAALREDGEKYISLSGQALELHRQALGPGNAALAPYLVNRLNLVDLLGGDLLSTDEYVPSAREAVGLLEGALDSGDVSAVRTLLALKNLISSDDIDMARLLRKAFGVARHAEGGGDQAAAGQVDALADLIEAVAPGASGEGDPAESIARQVLSLRQRAYPTGATKVTTSRLRLADVLVVKAGRLEAGGETAAAATAYREALSLVRDSGLGSAYRVAETGLALGQCLVALASFAEAEQLLTGSYEALLEEKGVGHASTQAALNGLVDLYTAWAKPEKAVAFRKRLPSTSIREVRRLGHMGIVPQMYRRDGGQSTSVGGRSVWVFGDMTSTGIGADRRRVDASWGVLQPGASGGVPTVAGGTDAAGVPIELIPRSDKEPRETCVLRPGALVWDRERHRTLVFYSKNRKRVQDGPDVAKRVGSSLALWPNPDAPATRPVVRPGTEEPTLLFDADEPRWGSAAIAVGPWLYAYACEGAPPFDTPCKLARVSLERALDRSAWLFYARGSWSPDWHAATPVLDGNVSQMSVEWNNYLGKYVAIRTQFFSTVISLRTADRPEGPWSELALLEGRSVGSLNCFGAIGHPELANGGGRTSILTCTCDSGSNGRHMRALEIEFRKRPHE